VGFLVEKEEMWLRIRVDGVNGKLGFAYKESR
jgi:hypothetical protein